MRNKSSLTITVAMGVIACAAVALPAGCTTPGNGFELLYDSRDGSVPVAFAITGAAFTEKDGYARFVSRMTTQLGDRFKVPDASFDVALVRDPEGRVELTVSGEADVTHTAAVDDYGFSADFGPNGRFFNFRTPEGGLAGLIDNVEIVTIYEPSKPWAGFPLHRMALAGAEKMLTRDQRRNFSSIYRMTAAENEWSSREGAPGEEEDELFGFAVLVSLLQDIQKNRDGDDPKDTGPPVSCETSRSAEAELTSTGFNGGGLAVSCTAGTVKISAKCDVQGTLEADSDVAGFQEISASPKGCPGSTGGIIAVEAKGKAKVEVSSGSRCRPNDSNDTATALKCTGSYTGVIAVELEGANAKTSGTEGQTYVKATLKICATIPPSSRTSGENKGRITSSRCD